MVSSFGLSVLASVSLVLVSSQEEPGFDLRTTNSDGPVSRTCFDAPGLPSSTRGSYYIAGPAKFDGLPEGNWKFKGIFDGLGMVNRFELLPDDQPTKMCYTSAWMNTGLYKNYLKDHKEPPRGVVFEDTEPPRKRCMLDMCDYMAPNDNNWVNMMVVGGEAVWFSDTPTMVSMDLETLNCTGIKAWADDDNTGMGPPKPHWVPGMHNVVGGSAHPLVRPGTKTVIEVMTEAPLVMGKTWVSLYTFDATAKGKQNRTRIASIEVDAPMYFHSYGVTPNYVVLPFNLINTGLGPGHVPVILGNFHMHWKGLYVVDSKGKVQVFDDVDPFAHVHIINTYENASGISMDLVTYKDVPFNRMAVMDLAINQNKTARDSSYPRGQIRRLHMNTQTRKTSVEMFTNDKRDYDFCKINDAKAGVPYCIYYCVEWYHDDAAYASMALMKHDVCQGTKTYWSAPNVYLNEPFFIPGNSGAEDDGTVIFSALDGQKGKAVFIALDAASLKEVERVELKNHIPFTAHGNFVPSARHTTVIV
jgi:carotenoid cleavage dioxygenase-like enzyme